MASSDEEGEIIPDYICNYVFLDEHEEPISFCVLPLVWSADEIKSASQFQVFLHATSDGGLQTIYKQVIAWRIELPYARPEVSVLSKDKNWIILQNPRKCYVHMVGSILATIHWMHYLKRNPEASSIAVWSYIQNALGFEATESERYILENRQLICHVANRDKDMANSKWLLVFKEKTWPNQAIPEDIQPTKRAKFIVEQDEDEDGDFGCEDFYEEKELTNELYDTMCAICDNGGEMLCCEGRCMRSFHATKDAGAESLCESLGYTREQVAGMSNFLCDNCKHKQHQCFACGNLGSSDIYSGAEVFPCVSANCGHFYHPECVAKLLHPGDTAKADKLRSTIAAGESFACPAHKCLLCKGLENKNVYDMQFALCRRCPKAFHRKCLPRQIRFQGDGENIPQRAWDGLLDNRILIYCMDHTIVRRLDTPLRDHLRFPDIEGGYMVPGRVAAVTSKHGVSSENSFLKRNVMKFPRKLFSRPGSNKNGESSKRAEERYSGQDKCSSAKSNMPQSTGTFLKSEKKSVCPKSVTAVESKTSLNIYGSSSKESSPVSSNKQNFTTVNIKQNVLEKPVATKSKSSKPSSDPYMEQRILALMKESTTHINEEELIETMKKSAASTCSLQSSFNKIITQGKVEGSIKAIRIALEKLEKGCSIDEAKAVCQPEILLQMFNWQRKLKVYLAPILHGMRYTSYGRHFTKIDKLKKVVDRLHWYVKNGDTIVDFCCGSNDFSCLLKSKLEQTGKFCSFRNYDLFQAKNDFNFERRDWMSVKVDELPPGNQLIMGLNPPFGVRSSLANQFIDKALEFKPKLLILIVPKETRRLDQRKNGYNLIWEDHDLLSGKSFYLPGSVDTHGKQLEDWNLRPPPLYLWSHPDWTTQLMSIARLHGHIFNPQATHAQQFYSQNYLMEKSQNSIPQSIAWMHGHIFNIQQARHAGVFYPQNYLMEESHDCYQDYSAVSNPCGDISSILDGVPDEDDRTKPDENRTMIPQKLQHPILQSHGVGKTLNYECLRQNQPCNLADEVHYGVRDITQVSLPGKSGSRIAAVVGDMEFDMDISP